ncbi:hypothetical protein AL013_06940 [Mariprofundus ferrooxydans]|nr:hypothetical protein AL013_06940 [Mariprofundus ferrooxydans]
MHQLLSYGYLMAAAIVLPDRRTGQIAPGAEYATIPGLWLEHAVTGAAFVELPAGVGRHDFALPLCPHSGQVMVDLQFGIYHVVRLVGG